MSKKKKSYSKYKSKMRERERVSLYVDIHSDVPPLLSRPRDELGGWVSASVGS